MGFSLIKVETVHVCVQLAGVHYEGHFASEIYPELGHMALISALVFLDSSAVPGNIYRQGHCR